MKSQWQDRTHPIKAVLVLAALVGFRMFLTDETQAYLQSSEALNRGIFINAMKEFTS